MLAGIEGIYRNGEIELSEVPAGIDDNTHVIITFLPKTSVDLRERGIGREQAADLRARLEAFAEDWNSPEMSMYDRLHSND